MSAAGSCLGAKSDIGLQVERFHLPRAPVEPAVR